MVLSKASRLFSGGTLTILDLGRARKKNIQFPVGGDLASPVMRNLRRAARSQKLSQKVSGLDRECPRTHRLRSLSNAARRVGTRFDSNSSRDRVAPPPVLVRPRCLAAMRHSELHPRCLRGPRAAMTRRAAFAFDLSRRGLFDLASPNVARRRDTHRRNTSRFAIASLPHRPSSTSLVAMRHSELHPRCLRGPRAAMTRRAAFAFDLASRPL